MTKPQQPKTKPTIVLFFHPGRECPVGRRKPNEVRVAWVCEDENASCIRTTNDKTICSGHTRRLIAHDGKYIALDGKVRSARLAFWGEWEAPTLAKAMPKAPTDESEFSARWVHTVQLPFGVRVRNLSNTDPCVFGSTFKYCCCQQHRKNETQSIRMRNLAPGSLILFGSKLSGTFALDTVFVVNGEGVSYKATGNYHELTVSKEYLELTLKRLPKGETNAFYRGRSFRNENRMYSFTPARLFQQDDYRCGKRFVLDFGMLNECLPNSTDVFPVDLRKNQGVEFIDLDESAVFNIWSEIRRQVRAAEFLPAVHFDWPK